MMTKMYRYERKFLVEELDTHQVRALIRLHPALFSEAYPPRYVNNIYLDTPEMDYYYDNVGGLMNRRKVRIRWYDDLFGPVSKPTLEFKIKEGFVGFKETYPFPIFTLDERFDQRYLQRVLSQGDLPQEIQYYVRDLDAVLVNRYYRWYYASVDGRFRVTVDSGMRFYNLHALKNTFRYHQDNFLSLVVELKYDPQHDPSAGRVSQYFPFPVTKNSKYVEGIERVFL